MNAEKTEERNYEYIIEFSLLQDAWMTPMFYVSFKSSWISNILTSSTVDNRTYVNMTFVAEDDLRYEILKYWHSVAGHYVKRFVGNSRICIKL
jgi:hypothetical protein